MNGSATTANCFSRIAPASAAAAHAKRRLVTSANASTSSSRLGASFWPNHAERIEIGLHTSTAPSASRQPEGPAEQERGGKQRERGEQHEQAVVVERLRQEAPDGRAQHGARGSRRSAAAPPRARARAPTRCRRACRSARGPEWRVVVAVRVVEVEHEVAAQLRLVGRVVREEPRRGRVAEPELEERGRSGQQEPTTSTSAMPVQRGSAGRGRASSTVAKPPHRSAARKAAARAMPRSHSSPAARTSGASGPCGSTLGGRKCHGSEPSSGSVIATSMSSTALRIQALALGHAAATSGRRSRRARLDAVRGREPDHEPRERVLEEAAVEERVHEQAEQARSEREPERLVAPAHAQIRTARRRRGATRTAPAPPLPARRTP